MRIPVQHVQQRQQRQLVGPLASVPNNSYHNGGASCPVRPGMRRFNWSKTKNKKKNLFSFTLLNYLLQHKINVFISVIRLKNSLNEILDFLIHFVVKIQFGMMINPGTNSYRNPGQMTSLDPITCLDFRFRDYSISF